MSCKHGEPKSPGPDTLLDRPLENREKELVNQMLSAMINPDAMVDDVAEGPNFTGITAGGRMGLAAFLGARPRKDEADLAQSLVGKPVKEAAALVSSPSPYAISLGFAALNAANADDPATLEKNDYPADKLIKDLGKDKTVGLVGNFPFVPTLADFVGTLHLFELKDVPGALPKPRWEEVLPRLDVLALTATTLLTRQMSWYLSRATKAKIIILGPTTPVTPVLFDHGADYLCGSVVTDNARVSASIKEGLCYSDVKKKGGIRFFQLTR
jgi:uncharacterized protein (DUF4213/DUF364 family)